MKSIKSVTYVIAYLLLVVVLAGCGLVEKEYRTDTPEDHRVRVVLEEDPSFYADEYVVGTETGGKVSFVLHEVCGRTIEGTDYRGNFRLADGNKANEKILTIEDVRYTTVVSVQAGQEMCEIIYHANGGRIREDFRLESDRSDKRPEYEIEGDTVRRTVPRTHLRVNTARADEIFERPGHTLIGWTGLSSEKQVSPGSRIDFEDSIDLYAVWIPWTEEKSFLWEESGDGAVITGLADGKLAGTAGKNGSLQSSLSGPDPLVIPALLSGRPVYGIAEEAFAGISCRTLVLPVGLRNVENGAFRSSAVREIYLFDDLQSVSGHAFDECADLRTLHIGAARAPVYSGSYFDTFADKCDRLRQIDNEAKIVLFSGSSTRFGYDSPLIEEATGKKVANMGVFAYTNALPQLLILRENMREGDILLISPEFDAAQSQFCVSRQMEAQIYAMCESDYGLISRIDLTEVTNVFGALNSFLTDRKGMEEKSYDITASDFDEDGKPLTTPSYNEFGDYILFRPNAETEEPVYGLGVDYTMAALPKEQFIDPFNEAMKMFLDRGVRVFFTYSPRNVLALSEASTREARAELHEYLSRNLIVPVISDIEDSLYTGTCLYGTDNHLSTEGVGIRTERVIEDLREMYQETVSGQR